MKNSVNSFLSADVLILGTGISGLTSAILLAEAGADVVLVTKETDLAESNTFWAQGGIIFPGPEKVKGLAADIQAASSNTSCVKAINHLCQYSGEFVEKFLLKKIGVPFKKNVDGNLDFTKEAAHTQSRIIYHGDKTGNVIESSLISYLEAKNFPNLKILKQHTAIDLITAAHHGKAISQRYEKPKVLGAFLFDQLQENVIKCLAKSTILATGGIGSLYLHHTNSEGARGDGHVMAKRAGAYVTNMEFIQFHPTSFYEPSSHRRFLISEALRGEGAYLVNSKRERFMQHYHKDRELAPRDLVSRAILQEMISSGDQCVYLDISYREKNWIQERFPTIYQYCLKHKIDITQQAIPVVPAAHYSCGGVWVDLEGKTSLPQLYAVGEVSCSGLHGANRLASTSLLEGLTWSHFAADSILKSLKDIKNYNSSEIDDWRGASQEVDLNLVAQDWSTLRQTMWNYVGIKRSRNRLFRAKAMVTELSEEIHKFYKHAKLHDQLIGIRNAVEVAQLVIDSSMKSNQSVGSFYLEEEQK